MFKILTMGENVSVIQRDTDTAFAPYILKDQMIYNPRDDFRPMNGEKRQRKLADVFVPEANELLQQAAEKYIDSMEVGQVRTNEPDPAPVEEPPTVEVGQARPEQQPVAVAQPVGLLESLIAQSVAQIAVGSVIDATKPIIEEFIRNEYGVLPIVHEFRIGERVTKFTGIVHEEFDTVFDLVMDDIPVFLTGAAGTGKNVLCKQIAEAMGLDFYFSNAVTQEFKITGFIDANGNYHETQFYQAFTKGGLFMLDEIDASVPEVLVCLNAAIANRYFDFPHGRFEAHDSFRIVAAGNTYGTGADAQYTGRYQLDASSLDRFGKVEIDYSPAIEEAIAQGDTELVAFIRDFRRATQAAMLKTVVSYRAIERIRKQAVRMDLEKVLKICLVGGIAQDDLQIVYNNMRKTENRYKDALRRVVA